MAFDISVNQFATYKTFISLLDGGGVPLDITSWSFTASIRETFESPVITNFTILIVSPASATLELRLDPSQTSQFTGSKYVYDVIANDPVLNPDEVYRVLQGKVKVNPGVTIATTP